MGFGGFNLDSLREAGFDIVDGEVVDQRAIGLGLGAGPGLGLGPSAGPGKCHGNFEIPSGRNWGRGSRKARVVEDPVPVFAK